MSKPYQFIIGALICGLIASLAPGCGYRFSGGGTLPEGISTVYVNVLENRTGEVGIENTITNDIMDEFTRNNKNALAGSVGTADATLLGAVTSVSTDNVSRTTDQTAVQRRVTVRIQLKLQSPDGRVLWAGDNISANQAYDVGDESTATDIARRAAIVILSKRLAEVAYDRMTVDF